MYSNLANCLKQKGLSMNAAAKAVGMPEPTFRTKLNSREFSINEAFEVMNNLFPEYDIRYLFKRDDQDAPTQTT